MRLSGSLAFLILFFIGMFIFFSSKLALDLHLIHDKTDSKNFIDRIISVDSFKVKAISMYNEFIHPSKSYEESYNDVVPRVGNSHIKASKSCTLKFPPSCDISEYLIKYWDEETPCYESPFRKFNGFTNPNINERKFVVMQPDLGGWNNIRMALELGILFALVTGLILLNSLSLLSLVTQRLHCFVAYELNHMPYDLCMI
jgi:hypothetical protein